MISRDKSTGVQPGFRMTTPGGETYQIEVDPPSHPEMATGAEIIGTAFYYAFGYHTVEVYLTEFDPRDASDLGEGDDQRSATAASGVRSRAAIWTTSCTGPRGSRTADTGDRQPVRHRPAARQLPLLRHAPRRSERHRAARAPARAARRARVRRVAQSRRLARREQPRLPRDARTARATSATTCSTSARSWAAAPYHAQVHRAGNEYIYESAPGWKTLATLGLYLRPWMLIDYPDQPRVDRPLRRRCVRSAEVEARVSEPGVREHAAGRRLLGGAYRRASSTTPPCAPSSRRRATPIRRRPST